MAMIGREANVEGRMAGAGDGGTGMREMRRRMRREWKDATGHTLYLIIVLFIGHIIIDCNLLTVNLANTPVCTPLLNFDVVLMTCGGPAPRVAPHRPKVLLPLSTPTLGRGSVPDKRVGLLWEVGPKLPWPYATADCMNIVDA